jgi:uncharacterized protein YoxC
MEGIKMKEIEKLNLWLDDIKSKKQTLNNKLLKDVKFINETAEGDLSDENYSGFKQTLEWMLGYISVIEELKKLKSNIENRKKVINDTVKGNKGN